MFPKMWKKFACKNIDVNSVSRCSPRATSAGLIAYRRMKLSPKASSMRKTMTLAVTIRTRAVGNLLSGRDSSRCGNSIAALPPERRWCASDAEVGRLHLLVVCQLGAGALHHDPAALQHVGALHQGQRAAHVLLDQEDGHAH